MNTLRGIISLTMLSFLVAGAGICDRQALALATPAVVRKKIQVPMEPRAGSPGVVAETLAPQADSARTKPEPSARPTAAETPPARLRAKSDVAVTPPDKTRPATVAQTPAPPPVAAESRPLPTPEPAAAPVATVAISPAPVTVSLSPATAEVAAVAPVATVATLTVTPDVPPAIIAGAKDGDPPPYNPLGMIDPFEPLFKDEPEPEPDAAKSAKRVPRTPLEKIDLGQLKLVGVILASSGNRALVQEASGKGYIIKEGTYIGVNSGKVAEIKNDRIVVAEEIEDIVGNPTIRNKELVLPKPPGE